MNNPSPLIPQGSLLEQKNRSRSRVKVAFFCIVGVHVVGLMVLLMQGCKREPAPAPVDTTSFPEMTDTNLPAMDTNAIPPLAVDTNVPVVPPIPDVAPVAPIASPQEYVIQKGDSFYSIGKKLNIPMKAIQDANPNVNPSKLQPGQKIVIPSAPAAGGIAPGSPMPETAGGEQSYTVRSGDNLTKIATQHGTTIKALRAANNLKTDRIKVGQKLIIPGKATAPVTPPMETAPIAPAPVAPTAPPGQ